MKIYINYNYIDNIYVYNKLIHFQTTIIINAFKRAINVNMYYTFTYVNTYICIVEREIRRIPE